VTGTRLIAVVTTVVCAGAVLMGCSDKSTGSPLPKDTTTTGEPNTSEPSETSSTKSSSERPREIALDGRNPCALVPESDFAKFYFEKPGEVQESKTFRSPQCFYGTNVASFAVTLVVTEGIEAWTNGGRNVDLADAEPVTGFPAVFLISKVDRRRCYAVVDVADGQYVMTDVAVTPSAQSKVPEKCDYAHQLAESAMKTLVAS
jgi:hypothetical protein